MGWGETTWQHRINVLHQALSNSRQASVRSSSTCPIMLTPVTKERRAIFQGKEYCRRALTWWCHSSSRTCHRFQIRKSSSLWRARSTSQATRRRRTERCPNRDAASSGRRRRRFSCWTSSWHQCRKRIESWRTNWMSRIRCSIRSRINSRNSRWRPKERRTSISKSRRSSTTSRKATSTATSSRKILLTNAPNWIKTRIRLMRDI